MVPLDLHGMNAFLIRGLSSVFLKSLVLVDRYRKTSVNKDSIWVATSSFLPVCSWYSILALLMSTSSE